MNAMASAARARVLDARVVGDAATRARWNREGTVFARRFVRVERALGALARDVRVIHEFERIFATDDDDDADAADDVRARRDRERRRRRASERFRARASSHDADDATRDGCENRRRLRGSARASRDGAPTRTRDAAR